MSTGIDEGGYPMSEEDYRVRWVNNAGYATYYANIFLPDAQNEGGT